MTATDLRDLSVPDLVRRFEKTALAQDSAFLEGRIARYNLLYSEMEALRHELKSRSGDQRRALGPLLDSDNTQVRLKAAVSLLSVLPDAARLTLEIIYQDKTGPQCIDAGMALRKLQDGSFATE